MTCAQTIYANPSEAGLDLEIPFTLVDSASGEPETGKVDSDCYIAMRDPAGTTTQLVVTTDFTFTEIDSTNLDGAYVVKILTAAIPEPGLYQLFIYPVTFLDFDPINVQVEIVNKQWPRLAPDFDTLFQRMKTFLDSNGVP